jgi:hypothetical protein
MTNTKGINHAHNAIVVEPSGAVAFAHQCTAQTENTNLVYVSNCKGISACCDTIKYGGYTGLSTGFKVVIVVISIIALVASVLFVRYRRKNARARHHSDLSIDGMLDEPLIGQHESFGASLHTLS